MTLVSSCKKSEKLLNKKELNINVIPNNIEKYVAFMLDDIVFINLFQFMASNLENLANNLPNDTLSSPLKFNLMKRKGFILRITRTNYLQKINSIVN